MSDEKINLKISAAAAAFLKRDAAFEDKMKAASGEVPVSPYDLCIVLIYLAKDPDSKIRAAAVRTLRNMPLSNLLATVENTEAHPLVLDVLAHLHHDKKEIIRLLICHPQVQEKTVNFLATFMEKEEKPADEGSEDAFSAAVEGERTDGEEWEETEEEGDFKTKYQLAQSIGISDKIKFALTGDKEWRSIMLKDSNKLVSGAVLKNPRITDQEIISIAKSTMVNEENVRIICNNKDWAKNYQIRKALVENNKTPLPIALRFLATLSEKDIKSLAKSKNVSSVIATQARKALATIEKRR